MNIDITTMVKSSMPNIRIELRFDESLYVIDRKIDDKCFKIIIPVGGKITDMPDLIGFKIKPMFRYGVRRVS